MLGWLTKRTKRRPLRDIKTLYGGEIAYYGLSEWWETEFTIAEREQIAQSFRPMGARENRRIDEGTLYATTQSRLQFLNCVLPYLKKPEHRSLAEKFATKIEQELKAETNPFSVHLALISLMEAAYVQRELPGKLDEAERFCRQMIEISDAAADQIRKEWHRNGERTDGLGVSHPGYKQLCIILERRGDIEEAINLCDRAESQGWKGDWDRRRERYRKKAHL